MKPNKLTKAITTALKNNRENFKSPFNQKGFINFAPAFSDKKKINRGTYTDGKSIVLDGSADYLSRVQGTADDRKTVTFDITFKRSSLSGDQVILTTNGAAALRMIISSASDKIIFRISNNSGGTEYTLTTDAAFSNTHKWYHLTWEIDTTQATDTNRSKLYSRESNETKLLSVTGSYPPLDMTLKEYGDGSSSLIIGKNGTVSSEYWNGYISRFYQIDGGASYTEFESQSADTDKMVLSPYSGSYGSEGCYLDFNNDRASTPDTTSTIYDQSGNSNNWTGNSLTTGSFTSDTPVDNYAVLNALWPSLGGVVFGQGNTAIADSGSGASHQERVPCTIPFPSSGKFIATAKIVATNGWSFGIVNKDFLYGGANQEGLAAVDDYCGFHRSIVLNFYQFDGGTAPVTSISHSTNDKVLIAVDIEAHKIWAGLYDDSAGTTTWYDSAGGTTGNPSTGANATISGEDITGYCFAATSQNGVSIELDFGQFGFSGLTVPTDYKSLSSANLPIPDNWKPQDNANIVLYTGDGTAIGSGGNSVTGVGFQPDLTWTKSRDQGSTGYTGWNFVFDSIRGATNYLRTSGTYTEANNSETLTSFDSDGFTVGNAQASNDSGDDFWSLNILADNTSGSSNTNGSITSTVATDGINFSIVTYTGTGANATVGHGLSSAPDLIIVKCRSTVESWPVYHSANTSAPETDYLKLNTTDATADDNTQFNDTAPTSSVFSIGTDGDINGSSRTYVAYCFVFGDVFTGGAYTGNGSSDGVFIPSDELLMFCGKRTDAANSWMIIDQLRNTYNNANYNYILVESSAAETSGTASALDIVSNGVKLRNSSNTLNSSGGTYIWWGIKKNGGQLSA